MSNDLRLELRSRNNVLWHLVFDNHKSVAEFCDVYGLCQSHVGQYLNLKRYPYNRTTNQLSALGQRLCEIAKMLPEDLFPLSLYSGLMPSLMIAEVESTRYLSLSSAKQIALPPVQEQNDVRQLLSEALDTLDPREATILRLRFGLDGQGERTLAEIGEVIGVKQERVRQLEARALRKLRHRSRSKFLPGVETWVPLSER